MINEIYNVKVIHYANYDEVHIYDKNIIARDDVRVSKNGEIVKVKKCKNKEFNPFTGEYEYMRDFSDKTLQFNAYKSRRRACNTIMKYARNNNDWEYFVTFTLDKEKINRYDFIEISSKISDWLSNMRKRYCPDMKYILVPEKHDDGAWHFHGLMSHVDGLKFEDSGLKDKKGRIIYNIYKYKYGFTTATKVDDIDCSISYLLKYVTKDLFSESVEDIRLIGKKKFWVSRNLNLPKEDNYCCEYVAALKRVLDMNKQYSYDKSSTYLDVSYITLNCKFDDIIDDEYIYKIDYKKGLE